MAKSYDNQIEQSLEAIGQAHQDFGDGLYVSSSFGVQAALMLSLLEKSGLEIPVLTIDTGFWFPETHDFKAELESRFDFRVHVYGPSDEEVDAIAEAKLWETDLDEYHRITKLEPMSMAVQEMEVAVLVSGVHRYQTKNRAGFNLYGVGNDGEKRLHPVLDWSEADVDEYFKAEGLLYHPLYPEYGSVGDWTTTRSGSGRESREFEKEGECGLHLTKNGIVRRLAETATSAAL